MDFQYSPEQQRFRQEFRTWLAANLPPQLRAYDTHMDFVPESSDLFEARRAFQKKMFDARWMGIWWPPEYGGRGAGLIEQVIYDEEYRRAAVPMLPNFPHVNQWGPTLMSWGTDAQKRRFLIPMLSGEETWCQGYSEPNAGSDLAGVQTRAIDQGDFFILSGAKIWTSGAQYADWMYLLARTDPKAPKHKGISCFYLEMKSAGVTVQPLVTMAGHRHFNQVFFDNVRLPKANLVGPVNEGWRVAMTTLTFERAVSGGSGHDLQVRRLIELARTVTIDGKPAWEHEWVRQRLVQLQIECEALKYTGLRALTSQLRKLPPGPEQSTIKLTGSELTVRIVKFASELMGNYTMVDSPSAPVPDAPRWLNLILNARMLTIAGGSSEIQHNILGERTLGLPKE
ncbi:MAG TPA: acyl-CoA dehydrogenase family protein [Candidatus Binataceae bacterium]|jgi:alkylation response protein AidB-like acyl-CoA dehydrogenase|nr:acyl-CoA dehydrogenase family protein [Candidatus Binataceae bacterium]